VLLLGGGGGSSGSLGLRLSLLLVCVLGRMVIRVVAMALRPLGLEVLRLV
jgi:hypothetical protein